ncbi:low temperature requirement protein A, partial [Micromonospora sp. NPDC047465]|uniref:low temperature requirement protein A n=1 Tax=Micromonospora sp. NPDC047465 TaxID=3154813 RepID=UPI0033CDA214
ALEIVIERRSILAPGGLFALNRWSHPTLTPREPPWLTMITGGPVIFLAGRTRLEYLVFNRVSGRRIIGITLLLALTPLLSHTSPLAAASLSALVLLLVAVLDKRHARQRPPEHPNPAG